MRRESVFQALVSEETEIENKPEKRSETSYLKSKLWYRVSSLNPVKVHPHRVSHRRWLGFALMNVGEFGNFLSYAYAP